MKVKRMAYFLLVTLLLCVSCTNNSASSIPIGERELPDLEMTEATYMLGRDELTITLKAQSITVLRSDKGMVLESVTFFRPGQFEGSCDKVEISSDASYAILTGNVELHQLEDDITLSCQGLEWNKEEDSFYTDGEVQMTYGSEAFISAIGLYAKFSENLYEFSSITEGRITQ